MSENLATVRAWIEAVDTLSHLRRAVARAGDPPRQADRIAVAVAAGGKGTDPAFASDEGSRESLAKMGR